MIKSRIKATIIIIIIALLGITGLQILWITKAIRLEKDNFKNQTNTALTNVANRIERSKIASKVIEKLEASATSKLLLDNKIIAQNDSLADSSSLQPQEGVLFWNEKDDGTFNTEFRKINPDGSMEFITGNQTDTGSQVISATIPKNMVEKYQLNRKKNPKLSVDKLLTQTQMMNDVFKEIYYMNLDEATKNYISPRELDSILRIELQMANINTSDNYYFGIYDISKNHTYCYSSDAKMHYRLPKDPKEIATIQEQLIKSDLKTRLFPNDILNETTYLLVYFPDYNKYRYRNVWFMVVSTIICMGIIIFIFWKTIKTIIDQKKHSEIKNDFINNMTHELKTPISTISLACQALSDPDLKTSTKFVDKYIAMIAEENKRLAELVEKVLQSAVLDKGQFKLYLEKIHIQEIITKVLKSFSLQIAKRNVQITLDLPATPTILLADKVHITNMLYNLIDNGIKYSPTNPTLYISVQIENELCKIIVKDNGIGIAAEQIAKVFEKLYRVPTGNLHNVKGFGLGLSYVKIIVEKHQGTIELQSKVGKGSTFILLLPLTS